MRRYSVGLGIVALAFAASSALAVTTVTMAPAERPGQPAAKAAPRAAAAGREPAAGRAPAAGRVPAAGRAPAARRVPAAGRAPAAGQAPAAALALGPTAARPAATAAAAKPTVVEMPPAVLRGLRRHLYVFGSNVRQRRCLCDRVQRLHQGASGLRRDAPRFCRGGFRRRAHNALRSRRRQRLEPRALRSMSR